MDKKDKRYQKALNYVIHDANNVFTYISFLLDDLSFLEADELTEEKVHGTSNKGISKIKERAKKLKAYTLIFTDNFTESADDVYNALEILIEKKSKDLEFEKDIKLTKEEIDSFPMLMGTYDFFENLEDELEVFIKNATKDSDELEIVLAKDEKVYIQFKMNDKEFKKINID